jgi:NADH:ubiquinone reductase (H+-translocating)
MENPRILVLGGGFAGMFAAREIERRVGWAAEIELINDVNYFVFQPLLPEVAAGAISTRDAVSPLRQLLPGVKIRQAQIHNVDLDRCVVTIFQGQQRRYTEVPYDHLVVALGQTVDLSRFPGLEAHAFKMKSLNDAFVLRNHVIDKLEHADVTAMPEVKEELLTFTVIGGGFSGVETVGEMRDLIHKSLKFYPNVAPAEIRIVLIEFMDRLLAELPPALGNYAQSFLQRQGVEILLGAGVKSATGTQIETTTGQFIGTRTVVATIGNAPTALVRHMGLPNDRGRIRTDRKMRVEGKENIWALGDVALIPLVDNPRERVDWAPPTAQFAVREARRLASNIAAVMDGREPEDFVYKSKGAMASLGARRGVAEVFGMRISGFPAWVLWRLYYLSFVPGFATKVRIAANWFLDSILGRSTVQTSSANGAATRYLRYSKGDRIFETGNRADGLYLVTEGAVELRIPGVDGQEDIIRTIRETGHFGERVLLGEGLRTGTVRALEDTVVLVVQADDFRRICAAMPMLDDYFKEHVSNEYKAKPPLPTITPKVSDGGATT